MQDKPYYKKRVFLVAKENAKEVVNSITSGFDKLSKDEKIEWLFSMVSSLKESSANNVPVSIFDNDKLSTFEALAKYMKEILKLRYVDIASLLNRSDKTIWVTYSKSRKKMPSAFSSLVSDISIPISNFSDRKFTIFESLVLYMKDKGLTNHRIASMLHRDDRTIWSIYDRAKKKRGAGA